jgi:tetratricopeptide (TPR) repeat protein
MARGSFPLGHQNSAAAQIERDFQAAMAAEDKGDLEGAEAQLLKLHKEHPGIFPVDESLGLLLASRGDASGAVPFLEAGVREQPASDVAHANLGAAFYQLHRSQFALGEFQKAVQINSSNISAQRSLGRIYMEDHRPEKAAEALLAAERLSPGDSDLKLDCATALLEANRLDQAGKMLSVVADADRSARAQSLMGELDEKEGKIQDAAAHLNRAVQLEPSEDNAWRLGAEFLRHWTFAAAETEFAAASQKFPESDRLRLGLGLARFGDAEYAEAIPEFADLLKRNSDSEMYAELLGMLCDAPLEASVPDCGALVEYANAHPHNARVAVYAASFLMKQNDDKNTRFARKLLRGALAANPDLPEAQLEMGVILQDDENWADSIPYLERAVRLKPNLAQAHYRLSRAYAEIGRRQNALTEIELEKKFSRQEQEDLERRLRQITSLIVENQ